MKETNYDLLKIEYTKYLRSDEDEGAAVFFVKNIVNGINTKEKWIDVIDFDRYPDLEEKPIFKYLQIELFERKIKPIYPKKADEFLYRAITWEAAHEDIEKQRSCGIKGPVYLVTGCCYDKNRGKTQDKSFDHWNEKYGGFDHTGNAPTTSIIMKVKMEPKWVYKISSIKMIDRN